jgi:hypothetical protein
VLHTALPCPGSARGWTFLQGSGRLQYWQCSAIKKKYLQGVLAARILTVDFVVFTLTVKKKSGQVSTCRIGPFPCQFLVFQFVLLCSTNFLGVKKKIVFKRVKLPLISHKEMLDAKHFFHT